MATAAESLGGIDAAAAGAKKGKSKLLLVLALLLIVLLGGGAALWFHGLLPLSPLADTSAEPASHEGPAAGDSKKAQAAAHGAEVGATRALEPFVANLADENGSRYLKVTLQVEFAGAEPSAILNARMPQIRDVILTLITSKTFADIRTPDGKERMREEVIDRINHVLMQNAVKSVYFTEFIVQ